ncbi:MAG TPA: porin family protein [Cytophagaceae bacterium]|jgi:hypothetical protein|nr:porin family protein [Cytophagaceae bacterium]
MSLFKTAILFFLCLLLSQAIRAQQRTLGISLGPSYSNTHVKNNSGLQNNPYTDGSLSIVGTYNLDEKFGLVLDVGINNRGMVLKQPVSVYDYDPYSGDTSYSNKINKYRYSFSYLNNSLMARYTVGGKFKIFANIGVYYAALLKTKKLIVDEYHDTDEGSIGVTTIHSTYANGQNYAYRKSDLGLALGFGASYGRFGLDFRYYMGAMQISKDPSVIDIHHSFSTVKLTYIFWRNTKGKLPHEGVNKKKVRG